MYNIAITKDKETSFFNGADEKPRPYPTLADALVSAQYLGLTRQDVELHFVKEGTPTEEITRTTTAATPQGGGGKADGDTGKPLEKMNKEQLLAYALEKKIDVNYAATKAEILAAIQAAEDSGNPQG